jgi:transglutaminase-like putative cysteine protease
MDFEITHTTNYRYGHPAAEAYGEARLTPPDLPTQTVLSHELELDPQAPTSSYRDYYGNAVSFFSLPFRHSGLTVTNRAVVRTHPAPPPKQALEQRVSEARQILGSAMADVFDYLQPTNTVHATREAVQWAQRWLPGKASLGDALEALNVALNEEFQYMPGATENSTPLATIWRDKRGVCQDFAHVGLSILRCAGLPCRYVCGYIETDPPRTAEGARPRLIGAVATHAWIEVMVPGMEWVAIDPTNRQWVNERYVAVSFGRDYRDATPLRGTFKGSGGQAMKVRVVMKRRNGRPEKTSSIA